MRNKLFYVSLYMIQIETKVCTKCKIEKPITSFRKANKYKDGYQYNCKYCVDGKEPHKPIIEGNKTCTKCKISKDISEFGNIKVKGILFKQSSCKLCKYKIRTEKRKLNPKLESFRKRKQSLKSKYNLKIEDYEKMYKEQKGCCKICNKQVDILAVDHCHNTLKIRGLLCSNCNISLGGFKDSIENLKNAITYLEQNNC